MDAAGFDFPTTVSRGTDLSAGAAETRTGHHVYAPLSPEQVERGRTVFSAEWAATLARIAFPSGSQVELDTMDMLRRPVARATCAAVLDLDLDARNEVAEQVLAWIDALAPVIASRRSPRRWSRARRHERRARVTLEETLAAVSATQGVDETPPLVANLLAAGIQVPIAAGAWLLVLLAAHPEHDVNPDHAVWETLRLTPPTWATARVTTAEVEVAGRLIPAGQLVMVSPLLLGRLNELAPDSPAGLEEFCPARWERDDVRPGAWLPFGAGAHACPGRTLGLAMLRDLATWAGRHHLELATSVTIDQSRGILPRPSRIAVSPREEIDQ